jgi:hypothetical protein
MKLRTHLALMFCVLSGGGSLAGYLAHRADEAQLRQRGYAYEEILKGMRESREPARTYKDTNYMLHIG